MAMSLEERQLKYQEFLTKFKDSPRHLILGTLETALSLQENQEKLSSMGLIEWEDLSQFRGKTNALAQAAIETLDSRGMVDRQLCKMWKKYHNHMWMSLNEPPIIARKIHELFEKVFGNIAKKNFGLKALSVMLAKHNWNGIPDVNSKEHQLWQDERNQLDKLSKQLREAHLSLEVDALWDYYAPGYLGNKPTFNWLMNDELFDVIESNEHYDLYILDQILSGEYEPDTEDLDAIYSEQNPEVDAKKPVYADIPYNPEGDEIPDELAAMLAETDEPPQTTTNNELDEVDMDILLSMGM